MAVDGTITRAERRLSQFEGELFRPAEEASERLRGLMKTVELKFKQVLCEFGSPARRYARRMTRAERRRSLTMTGLSSVRSNSPNSPWSFIDSAILSQSSGRGRVSSLNSRSEIRRSEPLRVRVRP